MIGSIKGGRCRGDTGVVRRLGALLVDVRVDEDAAPVIVSRLINGISAADVALRGVSPVKEMVEGGVTRPRWVLHHWSMRWWTNSKVPKTWIEILPLPAVRARKTAGLVMFLNTHALPGNILPSMYSLLALSDEKRPG